MKNTIIVCEYGWILVGKKSISDIGVRLEEASVVRRWMNGKGIGGLAKEENKREYTLDAIGTAYINASKILFEIHCDW